MGGSLLGVVVKLFVVLETKLLLLHWHSHLFQNRCFSFNMEIGLGFVDLFQNVCSIATLLFFFFAIAMTPK